ncbi:MAG: APC family permease [Pseudomonadota bacterium]
MSEPANTAATNSPRLAKELRAPQVVALALGAMIGWSWVLLSASWVASAGAVGAPLAFGLGGVGILLIALLYAELASAMPKAGGEHVYVARALGDKAAFWCSWALLMAYVTVCVFESVALPTAIAYLAPNIDVVPLWEVAGSSVNLGFVIIGALGAALVTWANVVGIRTAARVQTVVTCSILAAGALLITGAVLAPELAAPAPDFTAGFAGFGAVLIIVPAMLVGFDVIPQSAEEIDLPPRRLGTLLVASVAAAVAWYALISMSVAAGLPQAQLDASQMGTADAATALWSSPAAGAALVLAGIGGIVTSWIAFVLAASRLMYAMALDRMLPSAFARLHPRYRTPANAIIAIGALSVAAPFAGRALLGWLVDAGSFTVVIAYLFVAAAYLVLRQREPELARPFRLPAGRLFGTLGLLAALGLFLLFLPFSPSGLSWPHEWLIVLGMALTGLLAYRQFAAR